MHLLLGRWPAIWWDAVAEHSRPESFSAGVVTVRTDSTAWASQLRLMAPQLLAKLNAAAGRRHDQADHGEGPGRPELEARASAASGTGGARGDTYG